MKPAQTQPKRGRPFGTPKKAITVRLPIDQIERYQINAAWIQRLVERVLNESS